MSQGQGARIVAVEPKNVSALLVSALGPDAMAWITPVPEVFRHPHYYDQLPETLLGKREAILKKARGTGTAR